MEAVLLSLLRTLVFRASPPASQAALDAVLAVPHTQRTQVIPQLVEAILDGCRDGQGWAYQAAQEVHHWPWQRVATLAKQVVPVRAPVQTPILVTVGVDDERRRKRR